MKKFEELFEKYMLDVCDEHPDPSHDILHVRRVVSLAKKIAEKEGANLDIVIPAAYLHDCVYISKADARRKQASLLSADKAVILLKEWGYEDKYLDAIHHAVLTHSFSANIKTETLEARVVQDADRLDAMGAIGIARCFAFSGVAGRAIHHDEDAFCVTREPNDQTNTLDHFFIKLLKLHERLNTETAKSEGEKRLETMNHYLKAIASEL